ncbi:hypothetical protein D3C71_603270 [compost metagenome]
MRRDESASVLIRAMVGIRRGLWSEKLLVMLQAFVDDSTSSLGEQRLYLCAYINTADKWAVFSDAWDRALRATPAIEYFKASEAENLNGQFRGWDADTRDKKVILLATVIRLSEPWGCHTSVDTLVWKKHLRGVAPYGIGNAYFAAFHGVIANAARLHSDLGFSVPVDFVFDEQGGLGLEALMFHDWMVGSFSPEQRAAIGSTPVFRDDKQVLPLQAADMLAWHIRREQEDREGERERPWMNFIVADGRHFMTHVDEESIQRIAAGFAAMPNIEKLRDQASWRAAKSLIAEATSLGWQPPEEWREADKD